MFNVHTTQPITELKMEQVAPSIFAYRPAEHLSENYKVIPTIEVVRGLKETGYYPVCVRQTNVRDPDGKPFAKHMIKFRKEGVSQVGDIIPEIVLVNSHNGLCSYQIKGGLYRLVCGNGLIVGNDMFDCRIRHQGDIVNKMSTEAGKLLDLMPQAMETAKNWASIKLSDSQRLEFAEKARALRWEGEDEKLIDLNKLLRVRRYADNVPSLWHTYNIVQENLVKGGLCYYRKGRRNSTREIKAVDANIKINSELWKLTESMAESLRR